jgi:predicted ArsR family transcriptional regulator
MNVSLQQTRRHILDILREKGEATVDEIVEALEHRRGKDITSVTVRHHINLLLQDELIKLPQLRRRSSPGRPQHVYALTEKAKECFPSNYENLAIELLSQLQCSLAPSVVNVIVEGVADRMAESLNLDTMGFESRVSIAVEYLNQHGYDAFVETCQEGYLLHTRNCPYHRLAQTTQALCDMDFRLVASLVGVVPRLVSRMSNGGATCSYLLPSA